MDEQPTSKAEARAEAAAEHAKAVAGESARWIKDEAGRLYAGYQKQSKYFKWRTWIGVAYAGLALFSVVMAMPQANHISAYVKADYDYEQRLIIAVRNDSPEEWTAVTIVLHDKSDTYEFHKVSLAPNEWLSTNVIQYVKKGAVAEKAKGDLRPTVVVVKTDQGSFTYKLTED